MVSVDSCRVPRAPQYSGTRFESSSFSPTRLSRSLEPLSRGLRLTTGLVTLLLPALQPLLHSTRNRSASRCFSRRRHSARTVSFSPHVVLSLTRLLVECRRFGLFRVRSPLLSESRLLSFPPGTEMVHFPGFAPPHLWIQCGVRRFYQRGFPHSDIPGSKPACGSPRLIAACHVLHRHLLPRHPPCALSNLTIKFTRSSASHDGRSSIL